MMCHKFYGEKITCCSPWAVLNTFPLELVSSLCQSRVLVPPAKTTICMVLLSFVALMRYIFKEKSWGSLSKCNLHSSPHCLPLLVHVQDHPRVWVTVGSVTTWAGWKFNWSWFTMHDDHCVIPGWSRRTQQCKCTHSNFDWWRLNVQTWMGQQVIWL